MKLSVLLFPMAALAALVLFTALGVRENLRVRAELNCVESALQLNTGSPEKPLSAGTRIHWLEGHFGLPRPYGASRRSRLARIKAAGGLPVWACTRIP